MPEDGGPHDLMTGVFARETGGRLRHTDTEGRPGKTAR